jgi:hypothetical protein
VSWSLVLFVTCVVAYLALPSKRQPGKTTQESEPPFVAVVGSEPTSETEEPRTHGVLSSQPGKQDTPWTLPKPDLSELSEEPHRSREHRHRFLPSDLPKEVADALESR